MYFLFADLEQDISRLGVRTVLTAGIVLALCTITAIVLKKNKKLKLPLFLAMAITLLASTALLFGSTIYLNMKSESGGPVHWHTDIQFWACGQELDLRDPQGTLSNKIGTSTYHEHNDKRMHLEGVVVRKAEDASLEKFMRVTGGYLANDRAGIALNEGSAPALKDWLQETPDGPVLGLKNGRRCPGSDQPAEVQAFVYRFNKAAATYSQSKLASPLDYVMRNEPIVPPGDCLILEYGPVKDHTDKLCQQYGVRDSKRCAEFGVKEYSATVCNIRDVTEGGQ